MVAQLGYWRAGTHVNYEDVNVFQSWAGRIVSTHALPSEPAWQYPPGAVLVFLLPRLTSHYGAGFVAMILTADLVTIVALVLLARRTDRMHGVWLWLLAIPTLGTLPLIRFDMIPTAIAVVALLLATTSVKRFGFVVGVGTAVKAWPVLLLLAFRDRTKVTVATITAAVTGLAFLIVSWLTLGNTFGFLQHQTGRGLELEAVGATPWYVIQAVIGRPVHWAPKNGSLEILGPMAAIAASILHYTMYLLVIAVLAWWVTWYRRGPVSPSLGCDAVFTAILLFVVVSEVLSPQYMIWLIGVGAVAVTSPLCRVRRPVALVAASVLVTRALLACWGDLVSNGANGAYLLTIRNTLLLVAAVDAALIMWRVIRSTPALDKKGMLEPAVGQS